jgi:hypothetical protein
VGAGKRLFTVHSQQAGYRLITSRTTAAGVVYLELSPTAFETGGEFAVRDGKETVAA